MIQLLIKVNGPDHPGVTSRLLDTLPPTVELIEVSQAVVRHHLSLSLYLQVPRNDQRMILMELLIRAKEIGVSLDFEVLDSEEKKSEVNHRIVCTLLSEHLSGQAFGRAAACFAKHQYNIYGINMLSTNPQRRVVELVGEGNELNKEQLRRDLFDLYDQGLNISIQTDDAFRRNKRLVLLDMDSTLIKGEFIDELALAYGVAEQVSKITAQAMAGNLDYRRSFEQRLQLLRGMPKDLALRVAGQVTLNEGAERLIDTLKSIGMKVGVISGGFSILSEKLKENLKLDYAFSNTLEFDHEEKATGRVVEPLVDRTYKATILKTVEACENIRSNQIIAVGDGANDLEMLSAAGLGIAFHAKPKVQEQAKIRLNQFGLDSILYLMGLNDFEISRL